MSQVIRISENLYRRLEFHAQGFDTPAQVIEKILNFYEDARQIKTKPTPLMKQPPTELEIVYCPDNDESSFKEALLAHRQAYIKRYKTDGTSDIVSWSASRFTNQSSVSGNLCTGQLRGWKNKGIFKAEVSVNKEDFNTEQ